MRTETTNAASIHKVRRDARGGKRGDGDRRQQRIRRAEPRRIHKGKADKSLAGLASFGVFCRERGIDTKLEHLFFRLKSSPLVVYPMEAQLRLLFDANVAGEHRVFGLESLAPDPLFVRPAGGVVPSIDTVYRDLRRFDEGALRDLEALLVDQGLASVKQLRVDHVHLDIDTTVEVAFGTQQGALPGPNPRYLGRPSYHPMLAYCAEAGVCVGALLRLGNTSLGDDEVPRIKSWVRRFRARVGERVLVTARIDAGGDCAKILGAFHDAGARFIAKGKWGFDLRDAVRAVKRWTTVDEDAFGRPSRQVAELDFARTSWTKLGYTFRVVAVRSNERDTSRSSLSLWSGLDYTVQSTSRTTSRPTSMRSHGEYNGRAEVEPAIAELKNGWGIPGRLIRSGRCWSLRVPPRSRVRLE